VMGATKRVAEFIVRSFAARGARTRFVAVRFGNVMGSSGSVLEIFILKMGTPRNFFGGVAVYDPWTSMSTRLRKEYGNGYSADNLES
ncbi:MAG: polysaccharide biosynthesis protein, partial [Elusimicrobiota bacterium]